MAGRVYEIAFNLAAKLGGNFSGAFATAKSQMTQLQTQVKSTRAEMKELAAQQRKGAISAQEYADKYEKLTATLNRTEQAQKRLGRLMSIEKGTKDFQGKSATGLAVTAGVGAVAAAPVVAFAKAEQSAGGLKSAMMGDDGNVGESFEKINALAVELGNKLPGTTSDFHDLFRIMLQNGIAADQVLGGVGKAAAFLGVQLRLPYEEAGKFAAQMQKSTGTADADMMKFMDTVQKLTNLGVKTEELNQAFSKFGPTMSVLKAQGIEGANTYGTLLAMLTQIGMEGGSAGNALGKVFRAGFDEKKISKVNESLAEFSMSLDFTNGKGEFGGLDKFFEQMEKLKKLNTTQRTSVIKELFGDDAEVLQTVNVLLDKGRAGYDDLISKTAKQATLEQRVNSQLTTMSNLWEGLTGTATNLMAALGGPAAELLKPALDSANEFIGNVLMPWADENKTLVGTLSALAFGGIGLSAAFWGIGLAASTILAPVMGLSRWLFLSRVAADGAAVASRAFAASQWLVNAACGAGKAALAAMQLGGMVIRILAVAAATGAMTAAQWLWNVALSANPIALVILGIAGLVAAGVLLYQNWDTVKAFFITLWNDPLAAIDQFTGGLRSYFEPVLNWLDERWTKIKNLFSSTSLPGGFAGPGGKPIDIAANAAGGIYGHGSFLTTFAENSPEAAIPIDGSARARSLWAQTGQMLGMNLGGGGGGSIQISAPYAPVIHTGAAAADVQAVLETERSRFAQMMRDLIEEQRRVSYA